jgi:hypothetical protein
MKRARVRWASSTRLHRTVTIATLVLFITWTAAYVVGSAAANGSGYLDTNTSVVVTVLGLMVAPLAVGNLVLGLRLTARLRAEESRTRDE